MPQVTLAGDIEKGRDTKILELNEGDTIVEAYEKKGIKLPHGCLSGSCGACRVEILDGAENLEPAGAIEADTIKAIKLNVAQKYGDSFLQGKTIRLGCRAKIKGEFSFKPLDV